LRIAVAGGSIGGLCAGLALRGAGFDVQIYERISGPMETRGAGIVVQGELIDLLQTYGANTLPTTRCRVRRYLSAEGGDGKVQRAPQEFTSWEAIRTLVDAFPCDRYHRGAMLTDFGGGKGAVRARIDGRGVVEADVLVAADGAQSLTRRHFLPDLSSTYAGYVAWRGTLDETDAPPDLVRFFDDAFTFSARRARPGTSWSTSSPASPGAGSVDPLKIHGLPGIGVVPPFRSSTSMMAFHSLTQSDFANSLSVRISPTASPPSLTCACSCSMLLKVRIHARTSVSRSAKFCRRSLAVAKRGSASRSLRRIIAQKRWNMGV
jgi:FAD binding domain-like